MAVSLPGGRFELKPGIRLIPVPDGGVLLQSSPMRALKINPSAFQILARCRTGSATSTQEKNAQWAGGLPFLDILHQGGFLDWLPPQTDVRPMVSIVIPVYCRPRDIKACLISLQTLDYPRDKIEIIVVDDASVDHTVEVVREFKVRLIELPRNQGQSAARNVGVAAARGEIVAFLDSDCIAQSGWLKQLTPYFQDQRVALVGGYVDNFDRQKQMDRYEAVCSALNMGNKTVMGRSDHSLFYVPTCNMLVRKSTYQLVGGLDENLRVGEDVDLCWRLMAAGSHLYYIPRGTVLHKHRNRLLDGLLRRFDYGTSEAVLYHRFPKAGKQFPWQPAGMAMLTAAMMFMVFHSWIWLMLIVGILVGETIFKRNALMRKMHLRLSWVELATALIKAHFELAYYLAFYLVRYHLLLMLMLSVVTPSWGWWGVVLLPTLTTYFRKRPRLSIPVFTFFYLAEHAFYQCGALWGCIKQRCFRLYAISFKTVGGIRSNKESGRKGAMKMANSTKKVMTG